ncbi:hypothetical protein CVT24_001575 [Panaeolus cyanescens]|uniref:Uncharacterized protein n=1 Tax=Panaeolus cyanescens TaxID=181874 RepID=A0A409YYT2_9AGAR|nr:hypothetical protein CVT24_001575 [Panaeolus cyanescens]
MSQNTVWSIHAPITADEKVQVYLPPTPPPRRNDPFIPFETYGGYAAHLWPNFVPRSTSTVTATTNTTSNSTTTTTTTSVAHNRSPGANSTKRKRANDSETTGSRKQPRLSSTKPESNLRVALLNTQAQTLQFPANPPPRSNINPVIQGYILQMFKLLEAFQKRPEAFHPLKRQSIIDNIMFLLAPHAETLLHLSKLQESQANGTHSGV